MASYIQSIIFGGGGVDLKGQKGSPEFFIGANFAKDKKTPRLTTRGNSASVARRV